MDIETENKSRVKDQGRARAQDVVQKRALIVSDEPATSALIQEILATDGIETVCVAKSLEADGELSADKFDVVLIDVSRPPDAGADLVRRIRTSGFNRMTPIIMISDDQTPGALSRGFHAGASFFLYRPIDRTRVSGLIRVIQGTIDHERRRFRRVPLQARVLVKSAKAEIEGETIDVSLNGALVRVPRTLPVGSMVEVSLFLLEDARPIVGLGSVMRIVNSNQMGLLLDRLPVVETGRLQEFLLPRITDQNSR